MVTYLGSFIQLCLGREEHCKQISLACVGSAPSIWTTLGLPQLKAVCASQVYTAWAAGCSAGACPKQALRFVHFPGLGHSGSQVLCKGTDLVGHVFCAFLRSQYLRQPGVWRAQCPRWTVHLNHLVVQAAWFLGAPGELCFSSGELIAGCDPPGRCQRSRIPRRHG